ncbi:MULTISPECIES: PEGA domain-containing protein [unclassified Pseudoalteromonas]|uniref:PEGA domain-containing protein n=1 Tax=unclassified Pseudoalteromonas TaxID=194690 RepID=UPI0006938C90|nr:MULTISPECIES: PEGA domain-containing protein [unclassified Pseudoalteromonas]
MNKDSNFTNNSNNIIKPSNFVPSSEVIAHKKSQFSTKHLVLVILLCISIIAILYVFTAKSVTFSTMPASKNITLSGGFYVKMSDYYLMLPGKYSLKSDKTGYYQLDTSFEVTQEQNQSFDFEFTKLPGNLELIVKPKVKVAVKIDSESVDLIDGIIKSIPAGDHTLIVSANKYFDYETPITIVGKNKTQNLTIDLSPAWAQISISSTPTETKIFKDGIHLGTTPALLDLLQGAHSLVFKKKGYQDVQRNIDVIALKNETMRDVHLEKLLGILKITSSPSGASVTYGNEFLGKTPILANVVPDQSASLLIFKEGFKQHSQTLIVNSNTQVNKNISLSPILGDVKFKVAPSDALIYINDTLMGRASQDLTLSVKKQSIRIEKSGYVTYHKDILPNPTLAQTFSVQLKTLEQAKWENMKPIISDPSGGKLKLFKPKKTFYAGASRREQGRRANEIKRTLNLSRPFYLGFTEVTNKQFKQFQSEHSSGNVKGKSLNGKLQPVVNITWIQAALFCNWLSDKEKLNNFYDIKDNKLVSFDKNATGYRLPTEAEWIWSSRFIDDKMLKYPWGDSLPPAKKSGNFADISGAAILGNVQPKYNDEYPVSAPVASFNKNQKGIYDLAGNVAEWSHDLYEIQTGLSSKVQYDPMGPLTGDYHVIRGSSWAHGTRTELRLSFRDYGNDKRQDLGFRIAKYAN